MKGATVTLVEYNPNWLKQFDYEKANITNAIGDQLISIEHIGSTAIIGLKANYRHNGRCTSFRTSG